MSRPFIDTFLHFVKCVVCAFCARPHKGGECAVIKCRQGQGQHRKPQRSAARRASTERVRMLGAAAPLTLTKRPKPGHGVQLSEAATAPLPRGERGFTRAQPLVLLLLLPLLLPLILAPQDRRLLERSEDKHSRSLCF